MASSGGSESKPNWLLIKEHDDFERPPSAPSITDAEPNSVVTGRSIDQIARSEDHVWNSKDTRSGSQAWYRQESKDPGAPSHAASSPEVGISSTTRKKLPRESQPAFVSPQLAQPAESPPAAAGWLHELKLDGYRIQARKSGVSAGGNGKPVQLLTRTGLDWTHRMPAVAAEVARLPADKLTLDGEVVVLRPDGTTSFADLQASFQEGAKHPLTYFCFDLLHLNGHNTRDLPLRERKALLAQLLAHADPHTLRLSEHLESDGPTIFRNACKLSAEGIVSKRASAKYHSGRSSDWIKCKCLLEQEFVIGGYTLPGAGHTGMRGVGALLLGYYEGARGKGEPAKLIYAGRVGTGFNQKTHKLLRDKLEPLGQFHHAVRQPARRIHPWRAMGQAHAGRAGPLRHLDRRLARPPGRLPRPPRRQARRRSHPRSVRPHTQILRPEQIGCPRSDSTIVCPGITEWQETPRPHHQNRLPRRPRPSHRKSAHQLATSN
jgi:bifunctional non-homologous end joining protein LigD